MLGYVNIDNDVTLQQILTLMIFLPDNIEVPYRVFCEVPQVDYIDVIDESINTSGEIMSSVYKAFYEDAKNVYILIGEDSDNYGEPTSGSRNYTTNPVTKGELMAWVAKYGVSAFHVDFPRPTVEEEMI